MDTPGAKGYKKNMISSLVYADAAVLVIDASKRDHSKDAPNLPYEELKYELSDQYTKDQTRECLVLA